MNKWVVLLTGVFILGLINWSIWQKEMHIETGEIINLKLVPVDPRSIMQGDYMTLSYAVQRELRSALREMDKSNNLEPQYDSLLPSTSYVVVNIDENKLATFASAEANIELTSTQRILQYRVRQNRIKFATNAFFFAEGDEPVYRDAEYGQFRLNKNGEVLLTALLDKDFKVLGLTQP